MMESVCIWLFIHQAQQSYSFEHLSVPLGFVKCEELISPRSSTHYIIMFIARDIQKMHCTSNLVINAKLIHICCDQRVHKMEIIVSW